MHDAFTIADRQLEQRRDISRKQKRRIKREVRAMQYRHAALNGGGAQEIERRKAQKEIWITFWNPTP